jgi:hypothetical protein
LLLFVWVFCAVLVPCFDFHKHILVSKNVSQGVEDDVLVHYSYLLVGTLSPSHWQKSCQGSDAPGSGPIWAPSQTRENGVVDSYMQSVVRNTKSNWDGEYKNMVSAMKNIAAVNSRWSLSVQLLLGPHQIMDRVYGEQ